MGRAQFDIRTISDVTSSIAKFQELLHSFTQLVGSKDSQPLRDFWNKNIVKRDEDTWVSERELRAWNQFDLFVVSQTWGSTARGWGGVGGASMTSDYTVIIEQGWFGFACVFYDGKLVYICEMDDQYMKIKERGYRGLPGIDECREKLLILYKTTQR
jgi:hypothetical protein